jgi:hypothetical protein
MHMLSPYVYADSTYQELMRALSIRIRYLCGTEPTNQRAHKNLKDALPSSPQN